LSEVEAPEELIAEVPTEVTVVQDSVSEWSAEEAFRMTMEVLALIAVKHGLVRNEEDIRPMVQDWQSRLREARYLQAQDARD